VESTVLDRDHAALPATDIVLADVVEMVTRDATRLYGDTISESTLAMWAEMAVRDLWGESVKVTSFLPVLAMRRVRQLATDMGTQDSQ
jgi:hypothetical protein